MRCINKMRENVFLAGRKLKLVAKGLLIKKWDGKGREK